MASRAAGVVLSLVVVAGADLAGAQTPSPPSVFANLPGLTETQRNVAAGIQAVCLRLNVANQQSPLAGDQADLFSTCTGLVQNSNQIQGSGQTGASFGLSSAELAAAVSDIAPDEVPAMTTLQVEAGSNQFRLVVPRLAALRRGVGGVAMNLNLGGMRLSDDRVWGQPLGGGASADLPRTGRLGFFVDGNVAFGDKDTTDREVGFDFTSWGAIAGVDYRLTDNLILGAALTYTYTDTDLDQFLGETKTHSVGPIFYGTYYVGPLYVDGHAGMTWNFYDTERRITFATIDRTATGDTDGQEYVAGLGVGYTFSRGPLSVTPFGRLEYIHVDIDGYGERGANGLDLTISDQDIDSLQSALGVQIAYAISTKAAVLVPQVRGEWRHEFEDDSRSITARYTSDPFNTFFTIPTDNPDRDFFTVGVGLAAVFARGIGAFVHYETVLGLRDFSHHEVRVGVRFEL
jgi:uncharacterized protein with beta-barrel porin domain